MFKKIIQVLAPSTFLLMYVSLEFSLFKELGWLSGLVTSYFFTAFTVISVVGLFHRPPAPDLEDEAGEEATCRP